MFYNRFGCALLGALLLFVLPLKPGFGSAWADTMVMAATWILLFYSKITYAVVGGAFMLGLLWFPHARRVALGALATSLAGVLVVELFWSGTVGYLNDSTEATSAANCGPINQDVPLLDGSAAEVALRQAQSLEVIRDGAGLIQSRSRLSGKIFALDTVNPFNALAGRPAPVGADSFLDADITISEAVHREPNLLFQDVSVIMVPKYPLKHNTFELLQRIYGPYIRNNFKLEARSECRDAHRRRRVDDDRNSN
jgi:hypothetical protein